MRNTSNTNSRKDTEYFLSDLVSKLEKRKNLIEKSEDLISKYSKGKKSERGKSYYTRGSGYPSIAPTPECSSLVHIEDLPKQEDSLSVKAQAQVEIISYTEKPHILNQEGTSLDNSPRVGLLGRKRDIGDNILTMVPHLVEEEKAEKWHENVIVSQEDVQTKYDTNGVETEKEIQQGDNVSLVSTRLETNQVAQTRETNFETLQTGVSTFASEILDRDIDPYSIKSLEDLDICNGKEQSIADQTQKQLPQEEFIFEKTIRENCEKKRFSLQYKELDGKLSLAMTQKSHSEADRKIKEPSCSAESLNPEDRSNNIRQPLKSPLKEGGTEAKEDIIVSLHNIIPEASNLPDPQRNLTQDSLGGGDEVFNSLSHIHQQSVESISTYEINEKIQAAQDGKDETKKIGSLESIVPSKEVEQKNAKTAKSKTQKEIAAGSGNFENITSSQSEKADLIAGFRKRSASENYFVGYNNLLFGKNSGINSKEAGPTQSELESGMRRSLFKPGSIDICMNNHNAGEIINHEEAVCSISSHHNESPKKPISKQSTAKLTPLRIALDPLCNHGKCKDVNAKSSAIQTASSQDLSDKLSQLDSLCSECDSQVGCQEEYYFLFDEHLDSEPHLPEPDSSVPVQEDFTRDLGQTLAEAPSLMLRPNDLARKDSHYDNFFAIFSENVSRVETFKKFGQHGAAIRLLEEILEEFEAQDTEEEDTNNDRNNYHETSENPKDVINLRYYKIHLYNMLSLELYENSRYEEALAYAKKVLKLDRYNLQALYKSYQANAKLKNDEEAKSILKRVRKLTQLQSFSQSQQNLKLDNISIPSQLSSLTNGSFCEGLQNMGFQSKLQGAVTKIWSKFKLNQLSNKIDESST